MKTAMFNFENFLLEYEGGISVQEGLALAHFARECTTGCIVEIGSYKGKSAIALAHGLEGAENISLVYCIEPHACFTGVYGWQFGPEDRGDFYRIMLATGYYKSIGLVSLSSADAANGWKKAIGLLFIDADHRYEAVHNDVILWEPNLMVGGVLALDDATDEAVGPIHVARDLIRQGRFEEIETVGKVVFLRKMA